MPKNIGVIRKKFGSLIVIFNILLAGCSHCSITKTEFDGKTFGINPYGSGKMKVERISYWGNLNCVGNLKE